ncbi:hypothetical protein [Halioxenophilus aromaticivorans]|uniref:Uncharacterized protein n=1 Tax=Halioxenophilus aromaticivorans TaxID=1306992 RepID=A0AAV3U785_9ALTE
MQQEFSAEDLPYVTLSKNTPEQLRLLADILGIPTALVAKGGEAELTAMVATILYRHLDQVDRRQAMEAIRNVPNRALEGRLVTLALDTTFINPQWGMWSLSNKELLQDEQFHKRLDNIAGNLGFAASGLGIWELIQKLKKRGKPGPQIGATLVIWGAVFINSSELQQTQSELKQRTESSLRSSRHYN